MQTNSANRPANVSTVLHTKVNAEGLERGQEAKPEAFENIAEFERRMTEGHLKRLSKMVGIKDLTEAAVDDENEIRIWVTHGNSYPYCFILKAHDGEYKASYLSARSHEAQGTADEPVKVTIDRTTLHPPLSGWAVFDSFLKEQGLGLPIRLSPDEEPTPDLDGGIIVVEAKSQSRYDMTFFYLNTESGDGRKALKVCRRIEQEFLVKMRCDE